MALGVERWFDGESDPPSCTFQAPQRSCLIMDSGPNPDTFMFSGTYPSFESVRGR